MKLTLCVIAQITKQFFIKQENLTNEILIALNKSLLFADINELMMRSLIVVMGISRDLTHCSCCDYLLGLDVHETLECTIVLSIRFSCRCSTQTKLKISATINRFFWPFNQINLGESGNKWLHDTFTLISKRNTIFHQANRINPIRTLQSTRSNEKEIVDAVVEL
jgi:hypothetical protein